LLDVDAAIAPDREAMTTTVAIASLLNMGDLRLLASRYGSHSHANDFAATARKVTAQGGWNDVCPKDEAPSLVQWARV
jgi:hypothetical protein